MSVAIDQNDETATMPHGWQWQPLADVLIALESGSRPPGGANGLRSGIPSLSAEHMTPHGFFDFSTLRYVPQDFYDAMRRGRIHKNDILIVKDGATTGKTVFVDDDFPFEHAAVNEHVFICRPNLSLTDPYYLFAWLWSPPGQQAIRANFQGSAIGGINQSFTAQVLVPVAPLGEQRRVAAVLRERMQSVKRARTATQEQLQAARRLPVAELNSLLNALSPYPHRSLPELADFLPAKSIATAGDAEVTAITTACLSELFFDSTGLKRARMHSHDVPHCIVRPGEVLIARSNTPDLVGRATLFTGTPSPVVASDLTIRLWARTGINPAYLARFFSCRFVTGYWKERAGGASGSMKKITRGQLLTERVPVPPEAEQARFADQVASRLRSAQRLLSSLAEQRSTIDLLPAALLRDAFSGRL